MAKKKVTGTEINYGLSHNKQDRWHRCQRIAKEFYDSVLTAQELEKILLHLEAEGVYRGQNIIL